MPEMLTQNDREQSIWCVGLRRTNNIGAAAMHYWTAGTAMSTEEELRKQACPNESIQCTERNIRWNWFEKGATTSRMTKLGNITATVGQMSGVLGAIDADVQSCVEECQITYLATKQVKCHINLNQQMLQSLQSTDKI